jgi:hypothetical protein
MSRLDAQGGAMSRQVQVPARARELAGLDRVDYADAFAVETAVNRTPEQWVRRVEKTAPTLMRLVRGVHHGLGLRLAPVGSVEHVFGWEIVHSSQDDVVLSVGAGIVTPRIVALTAPGQVVVATLLRFEHVGARPIWALLAPLHRAVARHLLDHVTSVAAAAGPRSAWPSSVV